MHWRRIASLAVLGALGVLAVAAAALLRDLPDVEELASHRPALPTIVVDRHGVAIGEFFEERRQLLSLSDVPRHVVLAFLASEDADFYEHGGVDFGAMARAAWANLRARGRIVQGGSTITQQLAKGLLLSSERTFVRKLRDMALALRIERRFTKDQILELYLNQIYLGAGAYGLAQAAESYFGKEPWRLSVSEAALLAGLPKAPSAYSPVDNPRSAEERRRYVLGQLHALGHLDDAGYADALADAPRLAPEPEREEAALAAYAVELVRGALVKRLGNERVLRDGLRVETTLDLDLQRRAVAAVRCGLEALDARHRGYAGALERTPPAGVPAKLLELATLNRLAGRGERGAPRLPPGRTLLGVVTTVDARSGTAAVAFAPGLTGELRSDDLAPGDIARFVLDRGCVDGGDPTTALSPDGPPQLRLVQEPDVEGALLSVDLASGGVLALVGGYDFRRSPFNRATQARRQPGSAFKPFVYGAALEAGFKFTTTVYDYQVEFPLPGGDHRWRPKNYDSTLRGPVPLYEAFARSLNNATIRLLDDVGLRRATDFARRAGIQSPLAPELGVALGTSEVTLLELTSAYGTFAAGGSRVSPHLVERVVDRDGHAVLGALAFGAEPAPAEAISPVDAYLVTQLLRGTVRRGYGTARAARVLSRPVAGKTGTTNETRDAWFVGFSPQIVTGVWVGRDDMTELGPRETGARAALPIWIDFMATALSDLPAGEYAVPEGVRFAGTDPETGEPYETERALPWLEPFAVGRKARKSTFVPSPYASEDSELAGAEAGPAPVSSGPPIGEPTP